MSLPRSRWAMAWTQRSSRKRSWLTSSAAPAKRCNQPSSHMAASRSRWLVGSSSSSRSGSRNSARASATRIRQPPENSPTGRACAAASKPKPGQHRRRAGRRAVGADGEQALVDLAETRRVRPRRAPSRRAARRAPCPLPAPCREGCAARRRFLRDMAEAGAGGEADLAAIRRELAGDRPQQGGLAGAVAADQPDAPAGVHGEVGVVQQGAAGDAEGEIADGEHGHGARVLQQRTRCRRAGLGGVRCRIGGPACLRHLRAMAPRGGAGAASARRIEAERACRRARPGWR